MGLYDRGKRFYWEVTRRHDPTDPYTLPQKRLLQVLGFTPQASLSLLERGAGDVFNLVGQQLQDLEAAPGVGPAQCAKLVALFALIHQYEQWQAAGTDQPTP
jgi:hypothetical protein